MATAPNEGIMALPENEDMNRGPRLSLEESADAVGQGLQNASPEAAQAVKGVAAELAAKFDGLSDKELDLFIQLLQYLYDNPEEYQKVIGELVSKGGMEAGVFPEEHDPELLATMLYAAVEAKRNRGMGVEQAAPAMEPPPGMAMGGIANAARMVAARGRAGDTMLAHITPEEAQMLRARGGAGTINPATGLPEYGNFFKEIFKVIKKITDPIIKPVVNLAKEIVRSPVGKILATVALTTVLGPVAGVWAAPLASAGTTLLAGGDLKEALISGATAYFGAPGGAVANFVGEMGITNAAAQAAISSGIVGTGAALLSGRKLEDAVKMGLTQGAIGAANSVAGRMMKGESLGDALKAQRAPVSSLAPVEDATILPGTEEMATKGVQTPGGDAGQGLRLTPEQVRQQIAQKATFEDMARFEPNYSLQAASQAPRPGIAGLRIEGAPGANLPSTVGAAPAGQYTPTTISGQLGKVGSNLMKGEFGQAYEAGKELLFPTEPTPSQVHSTSAYRQAVAQKADYDTAYAAGLKELGAPGMFRTYAPLVGAGIGALGLAGGFKQQPVAAPGIVPTETGVDLIKRSPRDYLVQNIPGVQYDEVGNIIGYTPSSVSMEDIRVRGVPSTMGVPPTYQAPAGAVGAGSIPQPYNVSSMYSNLMGGQVAAPQTSAYGSRFMPGSAPYNDIFAGMTRGYTPTPATASPGFEGPISAPTPMPGGSLRYPNLSPLDPRNASLFGPGFNFGPIEPASFYANERFYADGGIASLMGGGYPRRTGAIDGPGTETSDDVPAMLSDGEFVMTAKAVRGMGNGSRREGAKKMYSLMHRLENNAMRG